MKLYDREVSGNCHKVRLLLSMLNLPYDKVPVDLSKKENRTVEFLRLNPRGQVPVIDDSGVIVWDSQAILVYLARRYGGDRWLPFDPIGMAEVMQWLAVSENEMLFGLARARAAVRFGAPHSLEQVQALGQAGLKVLDGHLADHEWLACGRPTIADLACFPYVALAPEGQIALDAYPQVRGWMARIRSLPGFVGMPGIPGAV